MDLEHALGAMCLGVQSSHHRAPPQQRQAEVAEAATRGRQVAFQLVVEVEQATQPLALDHQVVEGREQPGTSRLAGGEALLEVCRQQEVVVAANARGQHLAGLDGLVHRVCQCLGRHLAQVAELAAAGHAVGTQVGVDQVPRVLCGVRHALVGVRRDHPLGQVEDLLEVLPPGHRQFPGEEQVLDGALHRAPLPHAAAAAVLGEVARAQGTVAAHPGQDLPRQLLVVTEEVAAALRHLVHARQAEAVVAHRHVAGGMGPVVQHRALGHQLVEMLRAVSGHAVEQHVVVGSFHHRDGVDLHVAEVGDGRARAGQATTEGVAAEPLAGQRDATRLVRGQGNGLHAASGGCPLTATSSAPGSDGPGRGGR